MSTIPLPCPGTEPLFTVVAFLALTLELKKTTAHHSLEQNLDCVESQTAIARLFPPFFSLIEPILSLFSKSSIHLLQRTGNHGWNSTGWTRIFSDQRTRSQIGDLPFPKSQIVLPVFQSSRKSVNLLLARWILVVGRMGPNCTVKGLLNDRTKGTTEARLWRGGSE